MTDFKTEPQNTKKKWFDKLTTLSPVEGQITMTEIHNPKQLVFDLIWDLDINAINIRIGGVPVGAAFQPRLNNDGFKAISFRGWKATPTSSCC